MTKDRRRPNEDKSDLESSSPPSAANMTLKCFKAPQHMRQRHNPPLKELVITPEDNKRLTVVRMLQEQIRGGLQDDYIHLMTTNVVIIVWHTAQ